jgi:hypothetical protein
MKHSILSIFVVLLTSCSTITEPMPTPDITEERLHLHLHNSCQLVKELGSLYLSCEGEPRFMVDDACEIKLEKEGRFLDCSE